MWEATIQQKRRPNQFIRLAGILFKRSAGHTGTHTQTNCSENITPPRFRGGVKIHIILLEETYNADDAGAQLKRRVLS